MQTITTIGLDVAKSVFQVHAASSHHWSREPQALGHTVRLMPPAFVKPYELRCCRSSRSSKGTTGGVCLTMPRCVPVARETA
jgi:transposase